MKVMVIMKGDPTPDQMPPPTEIFEMMQAFNSKLADAGVLIDANGLQPSYVARRVQLTAEAPTIVDGPFAETKELLCGYWTLQVENFDEAIEWFQQSPLAGTGMEIELRKVGELEDFGPAFTDELLIKQARLVERVRENAEAAYAYLGERAAAAAGKGH